MTGWRARRQRRPGSKATSTLAAALVCLSASLLGACATLPRPLPTGAAAAAGDPLSGRMTVRVDPDGSPARARSVSAVFELTGDAQRGALALSSPLGTMMARAQWQPGVVTLATPRGESRHADLSDLTRAALGEDLPVAAMFDWLRGRPWPEAASSPAEFAPNSGFSQLGWDVDLANFGDALVVARRRQQPPVTVRVKLDRP